MIDIVREAYTHARAHTHREYFEILLDKISNHINIIQNQINLTRKELEV